MLPESFSFFLLCFERDLNFALVWVGGWVLEVRLRLLDSIRLYFRVAAQLVLSGSTQPRSPGTYAQDPRDPTERVAKQNAWPRVCMSVWAALI